MKSALIPSKHLISTLFLFIVFRLAFANGSPKTDSIQMFLNSYQYSRALLLIQDSIAQTNNPKQLYILMGNAYKGLYKFPDAIEAYKKVLEKDTTDIHILVEIAGTYKQIPDNKSAIQYYLKALQYDSSNVAFRFEIANCKFSLDQFQEALDEYRNLYKNDTASLFLLKRMSMCYFKVSEIDSSILFYHKVLQIKLDDPTSVLNLCNLLLLKKEYTEGIDIMEAYQNLDSTNRSINSFQAYFYLLNEEYRTAATKFKLCLDAKDTSKFVFKNLGIAYFRVESYDSAKIFLEKAYNLDTADITNLHFLGLACSKSFYKKQGIEYLEKAMVLYDPTIEKIASLYRNISEACDAWSNCPADKKIDINQKALYYNPEENNLLYKLASVYDYGEKDSAKAIDFYGRYLNTFPEKKDKNELYKYEYVKKRVAKLEGK